MIKCPICGTEFDEKTGRRPKKFCGEPCKIKFWNASKRFAKIEKVVNSSEPHQNTQTWVDSNLNEVDKPVTDEVVTITIPPKSRIQLLMEQAEQELKNKTK